MSDLQTLIRYMTTQQLIEYRAALLLDRQARSGDLVLNQFVEGRVTAIEAALIARGRGNDANRTGEV